jgi:hypothetical protein
MSWGNVFNRGDRIAWLASLDEDYEMVPYP